LEASVLPTCSSCKKFSSVDTKECLNCGSLNSLQSKRFYAFAWIISGVVFSVVVWSFWETFK
jgi:hypothetical protein